RCGTPTTGACDAGTHKCTAPARNVNRFCNTNTDCNYIDRDYDGVPDAVDNCVGTYNPSQSNADGDALGDSCDDDCKGEVFVEWCRVSPWITCTGEYGTNTSTCTIQQGGICGGDGKCASPLPNKGLCRAGKC